MGDFSSQSKRLPEAALSLSVGKASASRPPMKYDAITLDTSIFDRYDLALEGRHAQADGAIPGWQLAVCAV
ncbi:MAG: hypothetical protein ACXW2D_15415 [Burkholderiaceae bacterium]